MAVVLGAPQQITDLWSDVQHLVEQAGTLLDRLELLLNRAEQKVDEIDGVLHRVRPLEMAAEEAVSHAQAVAVGVEQTRALADKQVQSLQRLLEEYEPSLRVLAPLVSQATRTLGPRHIAGITALLDQLPQLVDRIEPALTGMAGLAPEIEQVTERMDKVGLVVEGLPGAKVLRRRGEAREESP